MLQLHIPETISWCCRFHLCAWNCYELLGPAHGPAMDEYRSGSPELFDGHLTGTDTTLLLPNIQPPDARCLGHIVNQTATHALDQTIKWTTMDKEIEETVVMGSFLLFIFVSSHILHSLRNMVVWLKRFALEY